MGLNDTGNGVSGGLLSSIESKITSPFSKKVKNDVPTPDFPHGFEIVEVINGKEDANHAINLTGNMLPMIPFEYGGEQRISKDYYSGNPEPATHVLGAKESDITIHGKFKDKRYQDAKFQGISFKFTEALEQMRRRGNLLKITLGPWVRYAYLERTKFRLNKLSEVEYELSFFIVGLVRPINGKIVQKQKDLPTDDNQALLQAASQWSATYSAVPASMPQSLADKLNSGISDVASAVNKVTSFVSNVLTAAEDVTKSLNRAIGLIKNARTTLLNFKRQVGNISTSFTSLGPNAIAALNFKSVYTNQQHLSNSVSDANQLSGYLASMQRSLEALAKQTPLARYKVRNGDTLQTIAVKYYGGADHWDKIYDHNKLTSTQLTMGMLLEIPRV